MRSLLRPAEVGKRQTKKIAGVSLTELLCVIAIIAILSAFYLPAIARAFLRVKKFLSDFKRAHLDTVLKPNCFR
jgi:prepilin-type N-terminal cleavage/methylation domain-containing protein